MDDTELARYPGLHDRKGRWYVRKRVPVDLRHAEKREFIRESLGTGDRREAVRRYPVRLAAIEAGFDRLRTELRERGKVSAALTVGKLERLSPREIEALAADWHGRRAQARADAARELLDTPEEVEVTVDAFYGPSDEAIQSAVDRLLVDAGRGTSRSRYSRCIEGRSPRRATTLLALPKQRETGFGARRKRSRPLAQIPEAYGPEPLCSAARRISGASPPQG